MEAVKNVELVIVGDIMILEHVTDSVRQDGGEELLRRLRSITGPAVVVGNFELVACPPGTQPRTHYVTCPEAVAVLARAGFRAVSVASNHTHDQGTAAIEYTLGLLRDAGIQPFGLGDAAGSLPTPVIVEVEGVRLGLLNYATASNIVKLKAYTGQAPSERLLAKDVSSVRSRCDVVLVSIHHGSGSHPSPEFRRWAKAAADAGADAVVGHHSHLANGVERIGSCVVAYGLGNMVASYTPRPEGLCLRLTVQDRKVTGWSYQVFLNDKKGYPYLGSAAQQAEAERYVAGLSADLARPDYDKYYWSVLMRGAGKLYLRSWMRDIRGHGLGLVFRKLRRMRPGDLRLLWHLIFGRR